MLYVVSVSALEVCAYRFKGAFSAVASRVWLLGGAVCLVCSLGKIGSALRRDVRERFFWGIAAMVLVAVVTFWKIDSFDCFINGEAANQVRQALGHWGQHDLDYTGCAHFCYPSRQYLLAALPTELFGRNIVDLRLSYSWMFFLGMLLFYAGLRQTIRGAANSGYLAAIGMLSILTFGYVMFWLPQDQTILPISLTMAATGWYLFLLVETGVVAALCLSWIVAMLATSYTTGLASWSLAIVLFLLTALARVRAGRTRDATLLLLVTLLVVSFGLSSFITRGDVQLFGSSSGHASLREAWTRIVTGYEGFFFSTLRWEGQVFMSPLWLLPLDFYLLTSLFGWNGTAHFVNALWAIAVVGAGVYFQGYSTTGPDNELHRSMVVLPPLIAASLIIAGERLERLHVALGRSAAALLILLAIYAGWSFNRAHGAFLDTKNRRLFETTEWALAIGTERGMIDHSMDMYIFAHDYLNVQDYVRYFFPNLRYIIHEEDICFAKFDQTKSAIILYEDDRCGEQLRGIRSAHEGFFEIPVRYGLKGLVFIPQAGPHTGGEDAPGGS